MSKAPESPVHPLVRAIRDVYEANDRQAPRRTHLGASVIGGECDRAIWLGWRWALRPRFSGRLLRLFQRGHREEDWLIEDMKRAGLEVLERDPESGKQWWWCDESLGQHFSGSGDGAAKDLPGAPGWSLLEFKTSNAKGFKRLQKSGVKSAKPTHYGQMQVYMGWSGLRQAVYIAVNKDDDSIHVERVEFDQSTFDQLSDRARRIIQSTEPPRRISSTNVVPPCCYCDAQALCFENQVADVNCRTCAHSTPMLDEPGAKWMCSLTGEFLDPATQERGCGEHLFIPPLVPYAKAVAGGEGWVRYQVDGQERTFLNVASSGFPASDEDHMTSRQLRAAKAADFDGVPSSDELREAGDEWELFPK